MSRHPTTSRRASWDAAEILRQLERLRAGDADAVVRERLRAVVRSMAEDGARRDDPIRGVFARLGDKWSPLLLLLLAIADFRHATLRRLVGLISPDGAISQRMLTLRLRALERDGLVRREILPGKPPGARYALTPAGRGLAGQIESLMAWTRRHAADIRRARAGYDAGPRG